MAARHPLHSLGASGLWETFVPGVAEGARYKFEIQPRARPAVHQGRSVRAAARSGRRDTASVTHHLGASRLARRGVDDASGASAARRSTRRWPIYEVHAGSWRRKPDRRIPIAHLARAGRRAGAVRRRTMGFTHIELLPVMEHPFEGSWGYQVTGFFAPTSRLRHARRFPRVRRRVPSARHRRDPRLGARAIFRRTRTALARFDGTALYEHADPRQGEHRDWGTLIFNYGRHEVRNFLLSNALYWLESFHVDGLRVDAVASMLYLDYSREAGEWVPNQYGGRENLDAIDFLRELNNITHEQFPGHGDDRRGIHRVSRRQPADVGRRARIHVQVEHGLDARHPDLRRQGPGLPPLGAPAPDVLDALRLQRELRPAVLARRGRARQGLADDEGAGRRLAEGRDAARALHVTCTCTPARSCCSWAASSASGASGTTTTSLDWHLLRRPLHAGLQRFVADLNRLYRAEPALHELRLRRRAASSGSTATTTSRASSRSSAAPRDPDDWLVAVLNWTPIVRRGYRIGVPAAGLLRGAAQQRRGGLRRQQRRQPAAGSRPTRSPAHGHPVSLNLTLPPLGGLVLKLDTAGRRRRAARKPYVLRKNGEPNQRF